MTLKKGMPTMKADFDKAARLAAETLIKNKVSSAPDDPLHIMKHVPGVTVMSFADVSIRSGIERNSLLNLMGNYNQDAVTTVRLDRDELEYLVVFNMQIATFAVTKAIARELGHIILRHDGSRPEAVRDAESICFAQHLLRPRAMIRALQESGIRLSYDLLGNLTGCNNDCLQIMSNVPAAHVPAELNRAVKDQFSGYVADIVYCKDILTQGDESPLADFGTYMDGYEE